LHSLVDTVLRIGRMKLVVQYKLIRITLIISATSWYCERNSAECPQQYRGWSRRIALLHGVGLLRNFASAVEHQRWTTEHPLVLTTEATRVPGPMYAHTNFHVNF